MNKNIENMASAGAVGLRALPRRQVTWTLIGVMLAMFLGSLYQTVVGTAMPQIVVDLGGFSQYTWITTIYIITSAVTVPIVGKLIDMYGRKSFYIAGLAIFVAFSIACGFSQSMTQMIVFRGIQGIGSGIMMANAFTVIGDLFPPAERGKYQGYITAVFGISSIIGPTLGGFLTDAFSWRFVFFVNVPLGMIIIYIFIKYFPDIRPDKLKHSIDYAGAAALTLTVVPTLLALSWGGVDFPWASAQIIGIFVFSGLMLALFIFIESRVPEPIIPLSLFKNRIVTVSQIIIFITGMGMFGGIIFIPLFFQGVLGTSATTSGNIMIPMMIGNIIGSFGSGQILARAGGHYKIIGIFGNTITALGIGLLATMNTETGFSLAIAYTFITGVGMGITMPLFTVAIQNAVSYNILGVASSSVAFFRSIGGAVGLAVLGSVMNNRFAGEFLSQIPDRIKALVPPDTLTALVQNPQALISPQAQAQLQDMFSQSGPQGQLVLEQMLQVLRQSLSLAISEVFFIGAIIMGLALIANFFLKEIPLRKHHVETEQPEA
ncbi:MAG: MDR family MFS transporter [Dehalococcoidales bacterium]|nr:MDR family MFS transporter [Dehalococcoidales bacterium]